MKRLTTYTALLALSTGILAISCKKDDPEDNTPRMTFTTALNPGEDMYVFILVDEIDRQDVWIDINNDGKRDEDESFEYGNNVQYSSKFFPLSSQTVTIYGNVKELNLEETELTSLDISKNTALRMLICSYNKLTVLNLSRNTALETLECANNQFTSLDVSKNTALVALKCYNNQLTSLHVAGNTALTELECGINRLTSLDISKNKALEALGCYGNQLTSLDISKNPVLNRLICIWNKIGTAAMRSILTDLPDRTGLSRGEVGVHWPDFGDFRERNHEPTQAERNEFVAPKNWALILGPG